jgi:hypothetical protein
MLIQALDALIPFTEDTRYRASEVDRHLWQEHNDLRRKLKASVGMSFFDRAKGWLDEELRRERNATAEHLFSTLGALLRQPGATRRTVKEGFGTAVREIYEARQSRPQPLS